MWNWDLGRLDYFQFDNLKKIARYALTHDLRLTDRAALVAATGLPFLPDDGRYPPWRNYSRVFRPSMICTERGTGSNRANSIKPARNFLIFMPTPKV